MNSFVVFNMEDGDRTVPIMVNLNNVTAIQPAFHRDGTAISFIQQGDFVIVKESYEKIVQKFASRGIIDKYDSVE